MFTDRPCLIVVAGLDGRDVSSHSLTVGENLAGEIMRISPDRFGHSSVYVFRDNMAADNLIDPDTVPTIAVEHRDFYLVRATPAAQNLAPILEIAAVTALAFGTGGIGPALLVGGLAVATYLATQYLIPVPKIPGPEAARDQASGLNTLGAPTNLARLGSRVPEIFGLMRVYPDLAIPPVEEWSGRNQSVTALYCLGVGYYQINGFKLGETLIEALPGVTVDIYGPQNTMPSFPVMRESPSARQIDLEVVGNTPTAVGTWTPWITLVGAATEKIVIDVAFPGGLLLYSNNGGGETDFETVVIRIEWQRIDAPGLFVHTTDLTFTAESKDPIRYTRKIDTTVPGVWRMRAKRMDNGREASGLSARINGCSIARVAGETTLAPTSRNTNNRTFIRLVIENNDTVAQLSAITFNCVAKRQLHRVQPDGTISNSLDPTSMMIDALLYVMREPTLGGFFGIDLDLVGWYHVHATLAGIDNGEAREFNGIFDRYTSVDEMAQSIATVGRCAVSYDGGRVILVRDEAKPAPVSLFNRRTRAADDQSTRVLTFILPFDEDGVEIDWFDSDYNYIQRTYTYPSNAINPRKITLIGVTHWTQVYRRAVYEFLRGRYRRRSYRITVTEEGAIVNPMDVICVIDPWLDSVIDGDVLTYDGATRTVRLDKPINVVSGAVFRVRDLTGTQIDDIPILTGAGLHDTVQLATDPAFTIYGRQFDRQVGCLYAIHVISELEAHDWQVLEINSSDRKSVELNLIEYSPAVFTCDTVTVPAPPLLQG